MGADSAKLLINSNCKSFKGVDIIEAKVNVVILVPCVVGMHVIYRGESRTTFGPI